MSVSTAKQCEICGKDDFDNIQQYAAHKRTQHPGWRNRLGTNGKAAPEILGDDGETGANRCNECGQTFATKNSLNGHLYQAHRKGKTPTSKVVRLPLQSTVVRTSTLTYCPCCGLNLSLIQKAMEAVEDLQ